MTKLLAVFAFTLTLCGCSPAYAQISFPILKEPNTEASFRFISSETFSVTAHGLTAVRASKSVATVLAEVRMPNLNYYERGVITVSGCDGSNFGVLRMDFPDNQRVFNWNITGGDYRFSDVLAVAVCGMSVGLDPRVLTGEVPQGTRFRKQGDNRGKAL